MGKTNENIHTLTINTLADLLHAISHPTRISIIFYLSKNNHATVSQIASIIPLTPSTLNFHINILKENLFIDGTLVGAKIEYRLKQEFFPLLRDIFKVCDYNL